MNNQYLVAKQCNILLGKNKIQAQYIAKNFAKMVKNWIIIFPFLKYCIKKEKDGLRKFAMGDFSEILDVALRWLYVARFCQSLLMDPLMPQIWNREKKRNLSSY